jgi:hypothetical protein
MSTRLKVASWNPSEINKTALLSNDNFQVIGVPLFDNEMIALAERRANISKQKKELIKWVFQSTDLKCIGDKEARYVSWFPFNIASYATLAKIEEITLFVARSRVNLNAFISMTTNLKR